MSHRGSLLVLPSGIYAWDITAPDGLGASALAPALAEARDIRILLVGTGVRQIFASTGLRDEFAQAGIGLEFMGTGPAARTYNVLLAEGRAVGAALIAVE